MRNRWKFNFILCDCVTHQIPTGSANAVFFLSFYFNRIHVYRNCWIESKSTECISPQNAVYIYIYISVPLKRVQFHFKLIFQQVFAFAMQFYFLFFFSCASLWLCVCGIPCLQSNSTFSFWTLTSSIVAVLPQIEMGLVRGAAAQRGEIWKAWDIQSSELNSCVYPNVEIYCWFISAVVVWCLNMYLNIRWNFRAVLSALFDGHSSLNRTQNISNFIYTLACSSASVLTKWRELLIFRWRFIILWFFVCAQRPRSPAHNSKVQWFLFN